MKKYLYIFVLLFCSLIAVAQENIEITEPPYGLKKVWALIGKNPGEESFMHKPLPQEIYSSLSLREKYTYNMIYGETYSQNCSIYFRPGDQRKMIFAELPKIFGENAWSSRQREFFKNNRDTVIKLMSSSIVTAVSVGANFKHVIVDLNARGMIPLLISTYNNLKGKDHDILTVLMLLMVDNKYPPFLATPIYKQLYDAHQSSYNTFLAYSSADETLILQHAFNFYRGLPKKN